MVKQSSQSDKLANSKEETPAVLQAKYRLNPKQRLFVDNYILTNNVTESARLAGYSNQNSHVVGSRLLKHVNVQAYLDYRLSQVNKDLTINAEWITQKLKEIAENAKSTADRLRAIELLAKNIGYFKESDTKVAIFANFPSNLLEKIEKRAKELDGIELRQFPKSNNEQLLNKEDD